MIIEFAWGLCMYALGYVTSEFLFRCRNSLATKQDLRNMELRVMSELSDTLLAIKAKIVEGTTELTAKIAALESSLGEDKLSAESQAALDELKAAATTLADIIPNAPVA